MGRPIEWISLRGYKSIKALDDFKLKSINVLIGANGSGKSNFVSFFSMLRELSEGRLELLVNKAGGADTHLFNGPQETQEIHAKMQFGSNAYSIKLEPTADDRLIFKDERIEFHPDPQSKFSDVDRSIGVGHGESKLKEHAKDGFNNQIAKHIHDAVSGWTVYHFHDTSETAAMRRTCSVRDSERLRHDGANLASFLYRLQKEEGDTYRLIVETIKLIAPFFDDFKLRPKKKKKDDKHIQLEWKQVGSDYPFHPSQLSDGTLRFIAIATCLLQPQPPATVLIDEPELGLHPYALQILASLILQAKERTQVIVSTQSASLLSSFEPEQIIVVERLDGASEFKRLNDGDLENWLDDYTLGEVWQKNVFGGGPTNE